MSSPTSLPIEQILDCEGSPVAGHPLGDSREGRQITGHLLGCGAVHVSLIGGCHADEPVGPAMLEKLAGYLLSLDVGHPLLSGFTWRLVPHVNPDGRRRNEPWIHSTVEVLDSLDRRDRGYRLDSYLRHVVRELPGDDIEFGFPRGAEDDQARPENLAVAAFLDAGAPYHLHGSFHGMGFAPGPWFLIEASWIGRTGGLRETMRGHVWAMGYELFDPDRRGEKGFTRIDSGFCTRPDSAAMSAFFTARDDPTTAAKFRPSSMEYVAGLGGDPLTFVSEMPLFLTPSKLAGKTVEIPELGRIRARLDERMRGASGTEDLARELGVTAMAIRDQQRLQLRLLDESLRLVR